MSDTNLDPSISALSTRATEVAASASPRELLNLSRIAPSLEQSENAGLEVAINSRAAGLAPSATATELKSIGKAIGNVLEPDTFTAGAFIPAQLDQSGKFLGTSGTSKNWRGVTVSGLSEVNISDIANDETLVYNNVSSQFENSSQVFNIPQYAQTADLPASATSGATAFDLSTAELKYWDGSEWKVAAVVAAAGGGGASGVTWTGNITPLYTITAGSHTRYGRSTAMNANYIAVGDSRADVNNTDTGSVYVYSIVDGSLQYTISGFAESHQIGVSPNEGESNAQTIAMSENLLLIGWGYDRTPSQLGQRARLYDVATGTMLHEYSTTAAGGTNHSIFKDGFGCAVTINSDETKIAVGANRWRRSGDWMGRGAAIIYDISDLNNLSSTPIKTIFGDDAGGGDWSEYGRDLNFSGVNTLSVLLPNPNKVFVHDVTDAGSTPRYSIETSGLGAEALDSFGGEWNDSTFVLAVSNSTGGNEGFGVVYVFRQADLSSTTTSYTTKIDNPYQSDRANNGGFSNSMKILGNDHILIGMRSRQASSYDGRAYIYNLDGTQVHELTNPDTANNTKRFGHDVEADRTSGKFLVTSDQAGKTFVYQSEQAAAGGGSGSSGTVGSVDWSAGTLSSTVFADGHADYKNLGRSVSIDDTYYAIGSQKGVVSMFLVSDDSERRTFTSTVNNQGGEISLNGNGKLAVSNGNSSGQIWIHDIEGNTVDYINTGAIPFDSYGNRVERGFDFKGKWFVFRDGAVNKTQSHPATGAYAEQGRIYIYDTDAGTSPTYEIDESTIIGELETDGSFAIVDGLSGSNGGTLEIDGTNEIAWVSFPYAAGTLTATGHNQWNDRMAGVVVPIDLTTGNIIISKVIPNPQLREGVSSTQSQLPNAGDTPLWIQGPGNTFPSNNRTQARGMNFGSSLAVSSTHIAIGSKGAYSNDWVAQGAGGAVFVYNISGATPLLEAIIYQGAETGDLDYYRSNATGTGGNTLLLPTRAQNNQFPSSLAMNDTQLFIGSTHSGPDGISASNGSSNEGAVFVVNLSDYTLAHNIDNPNFTGETNQSYFGSDVAVYGNKLVVGEVYRGQNQNGGGQLITIS